MTADRWEVVIGLEVHVQLGTATKLFCGCSTETGPPNRRVCPVCLGLPGALPATNEGAVTRGIRAALGLQCTVHEWSQFARKNYFYPDLPKGYQISQFDHPLATGGTVTIVAENGAALPIGIDRLHLEEDAGKSIHDRFPEHTALDFNRAGTPLAEIVTAPDLRSPADARRFLVKLKRLLRYLDVSECNMEDGQLRVDGNLSVRPRDTTNLGTKQEVKNLNSFAAVEHSLRRLAEMQIQDRLAGREVMLATFSAATGELVKMRVKEESDDYRYFPEPDLPPLVLTAAMIDAERRALPDLPEERHARYVTDLRVPAQQAEVLVDERERAEYFEAVVRAGADPVSAAHWVTGPALRDHRESAGRFRVAPSRVAELIGLVEDGSVSGQAARKVFAALAEADGAPRQVAERLGLIQVDDVAAVEEWVDAAVHAHPAEWARLVGGEDKLVGFFMGKVMRASGGRAQPDTVRAALENRRG